MLSQSIHFFTWHYTNANWSKTFISFFFFFGLALNFHFLLLCSLFHFFGGRGNGKVGGILIQCYLTCTTCVVYKATVTETTSNNQETYIGLTENEFKTRFNLHKSSFKLEPKRTSTTLSDHVWKLKKKNINFNIEWQVVKRVKPFAPSNKVCGLCLQEKLSILRSAPSLNKRSEIFGHCIHR